MGRKYSLDKVGENRLVVARDVLLEVVLVKLIVSNKLLMMDLVAWKSK